MTCSLEVKEPSFRIDGVFLPPADAATQTVFFAEIQFQKDDDLYHRFFCESFLYLYRNRTLYTDWQGVIILASRSLEPENTTIHRTLIASSQVQRIYLDELAPADSQPVGIRLMQLTIAPEAAAITQARALIEHVQQEATASLPKHEIIDIITTIAVYKFASLSREEVEAMLGLSLEETRVYQEAKEKGKEEGKAEILAITVPLLRKTGMTIEQIAQQTGINIEVIRQICQQQSA